MDEKRSRFFYPRRHPAGMQTHLTLQDQWRVVIVTGCTQGLGYHTVKSLAKNLSSGEQLPYDCVVLSCRNAKWAKEVSENIVQSTKCEPSRLIVLDVPCDFSDIESVRLYYSALAKFLGNRKIVSLINNAGIGGNPDHRKSAQGFDLIWATNHLGHFLLTILCLPHFATNSRIVNVSSGTHDPANKTGCPDAHEFWPQVRILAPVHTYLESALLRGRGPATGVPGLMRRDFGERGAQQEEAAALSA